MKRLIIAAALIPLLLLGCGKERAPEEYIRAENFVVHTSAVYSESQIVAYVRETTAALQANMSYSLNGTSVELYMGGDIVKTLDYYYTPDATAIVVGDFNYDGYDDIYIPYEAPTDYGYYYCYDPVKKTFKEDKELAEVGRIMTIAGDGILKERQNDGYSDRVIDYQWTDGKLKAVKKVEVYETADNKLLTNTYGYKSDGSEYLIDTKEEQLAAKPAPTAAVTEAVEGDNSDNSTIDGQAVENNIE